MITIVLKKVFSHFRYIIGAVGVAFALISATLLLPNLGIVQQVIFSQSVNLVDKFSFIFGLYGSLETNFTIYSASYLIFVSLLFGLNIALLTFYIRRRQEIFHSKRVHFSSVGGFIGAVLGIGCVACGSVVLTALFGLVGAGTIFTILPWHGLEFGLVGVILLLLSTYYLIKKISDPLVCPIN